MRQAETPLLVVEKIRRRFGTAPILNGISITLTPGTVTMVTGRNGSGKTTLLNCVTGFDLDYEGQIRFRGTELGKMHADGRARLGIVRTFQYPHVFPGLTVGDHVRLGYLARTPALRSYFTRWRSALPYTNKIIEELELGPLLDRPGLALSFGEMKVVNTARALAANARVLLLDEPLSSLHGRRRELILRAITRRANAGSAALIIEHETQELSRIADAHYELIEGKLALKSLS